MKRTVALTAIALFLALAAAPVADGNRPVDTRRQLERVEVVPVFESAVRHHELRGLSRSWRTMTLPGGQGAEPWREVVEHGELILRYGPFRLTNQLIGSVAGAGAPSQLETVPAESTPDRRPT